MSDHPTVDLCNLIDSPGWVGAIVLMDSGVWWTNQMGGTACGHPEAQGVYVPLSAGWFDEDHDTLENHFYNRDYDPALVAEFLRTQPELGKLFEPLQDITSKNRADVWPWDRCWGEAWVPVRVRKDHREQFTFASVRGFDLLPWNDAIAVLTYYNSD